MDSCVFCKIVAGQIPAKIIAENDRVIVFADRAPRAPVHLLIVPKKHIANILSLTDADNDIALAMLVMAQQLSREYGNAGDHGFNLLSNNGASSGQVVFHMHWHFLAGRPVSDELLA